MKAMKLFYFTGVVYCSLNSMMQEHWFSHLTVHQNPLEGLLNKQPTHPTPVCESGAGPVNLHF